MSEILRVARAELSIEDPWIAPPQATPVRLVRSTDAAPPRLATTVTVWYDPAHLNILFCGDDDAIVAKILEHDGPLYEEDVFEVFLAPGALTTYFELEVNPLGTTFDARVESPDGDRATMRVDRGWECAGLFAAVRKSWRGTTLTVDTMIRVPFASLGRTPPKRGEEWRANFYRIDRGPLRDEFSAWRATMKTPADFHVPSAFGTLVFD